MNTKTTQGLRSHTAEIIDHTVADARERWQNFRASSVYFQLKTLLLVAYLSLVALTVLCVPFGDIDNDIGARISVLDGDLVVGRYFVITNDSRKHWHNVRVEIDDGFRFEQELVPAGTSLELFSTHFHKQVMRKRRGRDIAKRVTAKAEAVLTEIRVYTDGGQASAKILPRGQPPSRGFWF